MTYNYKVLGALCQRLSSMNVVSHNLLAFHVLPGLVLRGQVRFMEPEETGLSCPWLCQDTKGYWERQ